MKKRIVSLLLCLALLCSLTPAFASGAPEIVEKFVSLDMKTTDRLYVFDEAYADCTPDIHDKYYYDTQIVPKMSDKGLIIPAYFIGQFGVAFYSDAEQQNRIADYHFYICPVAPTIQYRFLSYDQVRLTWTKEYALTRTEFVCIDSKGEIVFVDYTSSNSMIIDNLDPSETYHVYMVYEYGDDFTSVHDYISFTTPEKPVINIPVTSFKVGKLFTTKNYAGKTIKMYRSQKEKLRVFGVKPADATNPQFIWKSMNPNIVAVKNGLLYAKKLGTTTIKVKAVNTNVVLSFKVVVVKP